jgi:outer membrane protein OmpA-like peptidoglycan-associated protein
MSKSVFLLVLAGVLVAAPAAAQEAPTRDEMVEQLLRGEREADSAEDSRGFSLPQSTQRPVPAARTQRPAAQRPAARRPAEVRGRTSGAATCQFDNAGSALNLCATFAINSAVLTPATRRSLDTLAEVLVSDARLRGRRFVVEGHADATGDAAKNRRLSAERARAVQAYLVSKGVAAAGLSVEG